MSEGKVSSKYQLTLPAEVRRALGIKAGDRVRYEMQKGTLNVSIVRPDIRDVLGELWQDHDLSALHDELGGDAVTHLRQARGWDAKEDD